MAGKRILIQIKWVNARSFVRASWRLEILTKINNKTATIYCLSIKTATAINECAFCSIQSRLLFIFHIYIYIYNMWLTDWTRPENDDTQRHSLKTCLFAAKRYEMNE